jgi:ABC-type dipeptide/oligopeptide/nickel transport system permease subunit
MAVATGAKPVSLGHDEETKPRTFLADTWAQFKRNRAAVVSLVFIIGLFVLAVTANFWKNVGFFDDPVRQHRGLPKYPPPMTCAVDNQAGQPQFCFVLGADGLGRDIFSRIAFGSQVSLIVGIVGTVVSLTVGTVYGLVSGYYGGKVDSVMMRFVDFLYGLPGLVIIIMLQVFFKTLAAYSNDPAYQSMIGPIGLAMVEINRRMGGLFFLFIALGLLGWIGEARLTRGQVLSIKQKEFVEAARAIGASDRRIIFVHLLPNIIGPLIVVGALSIPGYIFTEAALSALGLGVNPPTPSWGDMISEARDVGFGSVPHLIIGPGGALTLTVLAFTFFGDGLRDALDPRLRGR